MRGDWDNWQRPRSKKTPRPILAGAIVYFGKHGLRHDNLIRQFLE